MPIRPLALRRLTPESLHDLLVRLADTEHDARLGDKTVFGRLGDAEYLETLAVLGARVPDERRPRLDRLHVVGKHVEAGPRDLLDRFDVAGKVGSEGFDEDVRCPTNRGAQSAGECEVESEQRRLTWTLSAGSCRQCDPRHHRPSL